MKVIVNNLEISDAWKIQLTIQINFISSKDTAEDRVMYSKSNNIEIMIYNKSDEVIKEILKSLLIRHQIELERSLKSCDLILNCVNLSHKVFHKIEINCGGSNSPDWMKNKKATTNLINGDDKCFQHAATFALNHEEIGKRFERNIKNSAFSK